jgi:HEAT repeat protein
VNLDAETIMNRILNVTRFATVALTLICLTAETLLAAAVVQLDPDISKITNYKALDDRQDLCAVQDRVRAAVGNPAAIRHLQEQFVVLLGMPEASAEAKEFGCRQLALIGDAQAVPALTALLPDPRLSHMARFALERIPGPAPDKALLQALGRLQGPPRIGVINSLGERGDRAAAPSLAKTLNNSNPLLAQASAAALGKISGPIALKALTQARVKADPAGRPMLTDACLLLARQMIAERKAEQSYALYQAIYQDVSEPQGKRLAALTGLIAARPSACASLVIPILEGQDAALKTFVLRFVRETSDLVSARAFVAELLKLAAEDQVRVIGALAAQKSSAVCEVSRIAVLAATKAPDPNVQVAALKALRWLGKASDAPVLLHAATSGNALAQSTARESLDMLRGQDVDETLMIALKGADPKLRAELIRSLGSRHVLAASPAIFKAASQDDDAEVRLQAFQALARLAREKDLPALIALLRQARSEDEQHAAEATAFALCGKFSNESDRTQLLLTALSAESSPAVRASLLRILGGIGGDAALASVQGALKDDAIRDTAIRVLAGWPDPKPIGDLAKLAESAPEGTLQLVCLRGYIRMVGLVKDCPSEKRLAMYNAALKLARRPDEKRLVLAGMAQLDEPKVLSILDPYLEDLELQPDAASATLKVAFATRHKNKSDSLTAIEKVLKVVSNENLRAEAVKDKESINLP